MPICKYFISVLRVFVSLDCSPRSESRCRVRQQQTYSKPSYIGMYCLQSWSPPYSAPGRLLSDMYRASEYFSGLPVDKLLKCLLHVRLYSILFSVISEVTHEDHI